MNILTLTDMLQARMKEVFLEFRLEDGRKDAPEGALKSVTVYDGFAPKIRRGPGGQQEGPEPPFLVVRIEDGEDAEGEGNTMNSMANVGIYMVAERPEDDGYRDVAGMVQKIRTNLLSHPYLQDEDGKKFRIERPINWIIQEDDAYPQWAALVTCSINAPQPVELFSPDDEVNYG